MKQKLFVLGLLLTFMVSVANAWTDTYEDDWWAGDASQKTARQSYVASRTYTYELPTKGDYMSGPLSLDLVAYDEALNEINTYLGAYGDQMPAATKTALKALYDDAVATERAVLLDWHTQVYDVVAPEPGIANRYPDIKSKWDELLAADAAYLEAKLKTAKALTEAQILIDKVNAMDVTEFYGRNSTNNKNVWNAINNEIDPANLGLALDMATYAALDLDDTSARAALVDGIARLTAALAANEAACKDADVQLAALTQAIDQMKNVLASGMLDTANQDELQAAYDAQKTNLDALVSAGEAVKYDLIDKDAEGNDSYYQSNIPAAVAQINALLTKAINGTTQGNAIISGLDWTYDQPLPLLEGQATSYDLDWTEFDAAVDELDGNQYSGYDNFNDAVEAIVKEYEDKKTQVETEWNTDAFNAAYTTFTKPSQWQYNQTAWNNAIKADAVIIRRAAAIAAATYALASTYEANQLAETDVFKGELKTQYDDALADVKHALEERSVSDWKDDWLQDGDNSYNAYSIYKVRENYLAAVNAIKEEQADVQTANSYLETMIAAAQNAANNMTGTSANEQEAKSELQDAIDAAQLVADKVTAATYSDFNNAKDITDAAKTLSAAFNAASNKYNSTATAVQPAKPDDYWVYTVPVYGAGKQSANKDTKFPLDWTEYEALRQQLADLTLQYDADAQQAANQFGQDYANKQGKAEEQYNDIPAWTGAGDFDNAGNWSYNQTTWQAGIDADVETMKSILVFANALESLAELKKAAWDLNNEDILKQYATQIDDAATAAGNALAKYNPLTSLEEADKDAIIKATVALKEVLAANTEEKEDVDAAINLLKANIAAAQALIDKKMVAEADKATLEAAIATAQAIVTPVDGGDYSALNNAADVTDAYMVLTDVINNSQTSDTHAPELSYAWTYSVPLNIGEEGTYTLDWSAYNTALANLQALQATTNDAEFSGVVNKLQAGYVAKRTRANDTDWTTKQAWTGASGYASNWSYNAERWNLEINKDANTINQLVDLVKAGNQLYDLLNGDAKTLKESTEILGSYSQALEDAMTAAQTVYNKNITSGVSVTNNAKGYDEPTSTKDITAIRAAELIDAYEALMSVIKANTEEQMDVTSAAEVLENAIAAATDAAAMVEDVDGGTQYVTAINDYLNTTPNVAQLLTNAKGKNYTETGYEIADAQTILDAAKKLNAFVAGQLQAYAGGITNINNVTTVDWAYAEPLRVGDNQDPAAQDTNGDTKYTLDWTKFDAALDELKNTNITAPEVLNIRDTYVVPAMETKEATAKDQWYNVPAWTGTNDKFVNQFQYNQTTWQAGINEDVKVMQNATKVFATLNALDAQIKEAEAFIASEEMLQASYLKKALQDAIDAAKAHYTGMTDGTIDPTELNYATTQAISIGLKDARDAVDEETKSVKTVQPLLNSAIADAKAAKKTVENVEGGKAFADNIQAAIDAAQTILDNAQDNKFLSGDIKYAKTLTNAIRDLNKAVRDNVGEYTSSIDNVAPVLLEWMYAQPLRIGKEKDPVAQDANHETVYTLDWTEFDKALSDLNATYNALQNADLKSKAELIYNSYGAKKTQAKSQWTSEPAWTGINDKYVNQYQYNQTAWNNGIANDAKVINNFIDLIVAMDKLNQSMTNAKDTEKVIPAAGNTNVVKPFAAGIDEKYTAAENLFNEYIAKLADTDFYATNYDVQKVNGAQSALDLLVAVNKEEKKDIDDYRPLIFESIKVAQDLQKKIEDAAETKYYDALGEAIKTANTVYNNAYNGKYNEFNNAQEVTKARRALVVAMIKQQNAYQDTISALKDTLQQTIDDARAASLVVNTHNTYSTDLQNEIAGAFAMMSGDAMLLPTDNQDLNITKLQAEITRLKRIYCSAFILDLDSLKAAIADAQKFYDGITPFVGYKGVEKAQTDIKTAIETAQAFLTEAEAKNATQTSTSNPYNPTFTTADAFNTYNTVDVPAATDALNKAHMAINLAALKAVADSIKSYVDNEQVVTLYQNSLNQVIDHANSVYGQYQPSAEDKAAFSNFETQDKITDAIVTAIGDAQKFYAANDDAIAEAETVRAKLATKIADATTLKGELTDATSKNNLQTAIETATTLKDTKSASPEELTNGITALDLAMKTARWTDDIARLKSAIQTKEEQNGDLTDEDAKEIMTLYITKAQALLAKLQASVYTTVTTAEVSAMISELDKGLTQAQTYNNGEMLPDLLAKAATYKDLIPEEYQAALDAQKNSASLAYAAVKAAGDALAKATDQAEDYTLAKADLQTAINEAKLSEDPSDDLKLAISNAETAVAAAFTKDQTALDAILLNMELATIGLTSVMDHDRWSHQAIGGKMIVQPWKANDPNPGQSQYIKLAGKYTSADAGVANNAVDLFITNVNGSAGTRTFDWAPFSAESDYAANIVNLSNVGVSDFNNFKKYGWNYDEHYNDVIIKAGAIYSSGDGFVNANHAYGPFTWTNVWNQNDIDILDKDADGNYYGRYYTFKWNETNEGGIYRIPTLLGIYDETGDDFKVDGIKTYISKPTVEGDYFINADLELEGDKGYDTEATVFNYEKGTAILNGRWHRVQFIDKNQFLFHQAAQKAADWFNNNPDLRQYDTQALAELRKAVESKGNGWELMTKAVEDAMEKVINSYGKVDMILGDSLYGVIADGDYADVERTYTVTGAPGDAIDALIIPQTNNGWTKDDAQYWEIVDADAVVGADSTATIKVKFNPGTTYPADYREYRAILDVLVGNLNYQNTDKENLQQNLYGSNPKLSLKENELLQAHSLNLHRKDSITYDLYGRGYAHLYEKSPLTAKFYSATGLLLAESEVKTTLVKNQFTAYAADNDLDQTKFTVSYYPEDLGVDVVKVVISDTIRQADDIVLTVNAAKSQITFDPATVTDVNQNSIKLDKMADGTDSYFFPADGETYFFPIAISNFDGVNANTKVVNEDGVISITTEVTDPTTGLVVEHERHDVQITIDNRDYFTVETATTQINGTSKNIFVISVKTDKLEQGTLDDGQHDGLLQIIWQDQDSINIHLNQTLPWFSAPTTAAPGAGPIVDSVDGNIEWEFTEDGDKIWYVDVNDVDNYYNYAMNFGAYTNTDWFIVDPAISYQLTPQRGTRKYRLKITYNPHEVNTVYTDVLTLNIFDTKRNVIVATTSINLKGDAVSSIKGGATGVNNAEVDNSKKDGKYFKNGKIVIVKGDQEFNASGAQMK